MAGQMASEDDDEILYCICKAPYDGVRFMIECDACEDWFHGSCVNVTESEATNIEIYHCPTCTLVYGESISKKKKKKSKKSEGSATRSSARQKANAPQIGSKAFVELLLQKEFPNGDAILIRLSNGHEFSVSYLEDHGFTQPIKVANADGLDMKLPHASFSVKDVEKLVGSKKELDVIDVEKQSDFKMTLQDWVKYYCKPVRPRVLNVISLEFSNTPMAEVVQPPQIVKQISWVENCWPDDETILKMPLVQCYCLMGVKGAYTDFHVDFGGTSVWYHVLKGEKIFYMIEPTQENLTLYEKWLSSSSRTQFYGDLVDACYQCVVKPGNTLFIPAGWIHAVYTPVDSLVFGGNFLHHFSIDMQIKIFEVEKRCQTPLRYMFPNFETVHWYAAKKVHDDLRDFIDNNEDPPNYLLYGAKQLAHALQSWSRRKGFMDEKAIPKNIQHGKLLRELHQQVKNLTINKGRVVSSPSKSRSPVRPGGMVIAIAKPKPKSPVKQQPVEEFVPEMKEEEVVEEEVLPEKEDVKGISFDLSRSEVATTQAEASATESASEGLFDLPHLIDHNYACEEGKEKVQPSCSQDELLQSQHGAQLSTSEDEMAIVDTEDIDDSQNNAPTTAAQSVKSQQRSSQMRTRGRPSKPAHKDQEFFYPGLAASDSDDDQQEKKSVQQRRERKAPQERTPRTKRPTTTVKQRLGKLLKLS